MNKLVLLLLLMSPSLWAERIYCPSSLLCTAQSCDAIPNDFYISSSYILNIQYVFSKATVVLGVASKCTYVNNRNRLVLSAKKSLMPDQSMGEQAWFSLAGPMGGLYACEFFAQSCPFVEAD